MSRSFCLQVARFGVIGVTAAVVNTVVVVIGVEWLHWHPLLANILAFAIAYQVSFFGHQYWTFRRVAADSAATSWIKFLAVAVFSFGLNESLYALFLTIFHLQYVLALILVIVLVPPVTFVLSKLWAFR